ncbi:PKD domain-containing protein [Halorussus amylolyticus]|uniref:PKD domain-containing protein n=1 Tax=Halorussus amylolyticus TaxID=1126242 RepID=UPI001051AF55|nr:PKD domain-containing protein [Halorussus amylolyticus]
MTRIRTYPVLVVVVTLLLVASVVSLSGGTATAAENTFVVEQGDDCFEVSPLQGDEDVESFYDYRNPLNSDEYTYSSYMPDHLPREDASRMFLYDGPDGVSLVMVHNERGGTGGGSAATFRFSGLPDDGEWAIVDDNYDGRDDRISRNRIDWTWYGDRTDGGAFNGLDDAGTEITVTPEFNEDAALYDDLDRTGELTAWEFLTGSLGGPDVEGLDMDRPVTIRAGHCTDETPPNADLSGSDGVAGFPVSLDASASSDNRGIEEYRWDFDGDGEVDRTTESAQVEHTYDETGEYRVGVTVVDGGDNTDAAATNVTVETDDPPDAELEVATESPTEGFETVLDASSSTDDVGIAEYRWDFDGDGEVDRTTESAEVSRVYNETGDFDATVTVVDRGGYNDTAEVGVSVGEDEPPDAELEISSPDDPVEGEQVVFDASNSTDDTGIAAYRWDFGDNETATGETVTHRYDGNGTFEVTLEVVDEGGQNATETEDVEVLPPDTTPPEADASADREEVEADVDVTFDAGDSTDDREIAGYEWDFGDGETATGQNATHAYGSAGTYNATVTVIDGNDNADTANVTVEVTPARPPNVTASVPESVEFNETVEVEGSASDPSGIASYEWDFGDGTTAEGEDASHVYESPGNYTVTLTATDRGGHVNRTAAQVTVEAPDTTPPTARLTVGENETAVGDSVTFDANNSTDDEGIAEYRWDFDGDGEIDATTEDATESHEYDEVGNYTATVVVVDGNENAANASVGMTVEARESPYPGDGDDGNSGDGDDDSGGGGSGGSSSGGGGGTGAGPPSIITTPEERGPNAAAVDVRNGRADEEIRAALPESEVADESGVRFESVTVTLGSDDPHFVVETERDAENASELRTDELLGSLGVGAAYLDSETVETASYEVVVSRDRLDDAGLAPGDLAAFQRIDGEWREVNATVERRDEGIVLRADTDALAPVAVGGDRAVTLTDASLDAEEIAASDPVTVTATVENERDESVETAANLTVDGEVVDSKTVELSGGETADIAFEHRLDPGTHEVGIDGERVGTVAVADPVADIAVADVALNASTIAPGEQVEITANVENEGGAAGEHDVTLTMFGEDLETRTVEVAGGETEAVTFVQEVGAEGEYTVEVGDRTAELVAEDEQATDDPQDGASAPIPGFGASATVVALAAAVLVARWRRSGSA